MEGQMKEIELRVRNWINQITFVRLQQKAEIVLNKRNVTKKYETYIQLWQISV